MAIYYYSVSDLSSANIIMPVPMSAIGLTANSKFAYQVFAFDNYFTGGTPTPPSRVTRTPSAPRFVAGRGATSMMPVGGVKALTVNRNIAGDAASPSQSGLLLMYYDGKKGAEASAIVVTP